MRLELDLNSIEGYRQFMRIKSLPVYRFVGRVAHFPDEYAARLGLDIIGSEDREYVPLPLLFDYQRDISAMAIRRRKFAVFADCGLGKTNIMLEFARHASESMARSRSVLIVSPLMIIDQTIGEAKRFYGDGLSITPLRSREVPGFLEGSQGGIGITNYEAITDKVKAGNIGGLILDESSMLKSHYGRWGQRLIDLGRGLDWKLCLTGTPAPNDRIEYANHAVILDQFPTVNSFLAKFFVNRGETQNRWELKPHALRPFYRALSHWCIFLTRPGIYGWKDNTAPLPPIRTHIHEVSLTAQQWSDAAVVTGNLFGAPGGIGQRAKIARIAKSGVGNKPQFVADLVIGGKGQCLVWCKYNSEQDELAALLPKAANISGATPNEKRVELVRAYQSGKRREMISKGKILGFGLNLQMTRRMVFSTLQDSFEEYYQCVKRANRHGAKHPLDVHIPITDLELPMLETVLRKADMVRQDTEEQERIFQEVGIGR